MQVYLVGGAVRDQLLGLSVRERDWVVVGSTPQELLDAGYSQVGRDFPVFLHPDSKEEYALARTERKSGQGYTGFDCYTGQDVTLEQDLLRRDLTINAIARDQHGQLHDPYGGVQDIEAKLLRHVSAAFSEDPLRVLRTARFAARFSPLGFKVATETLALMRAMSDSGELNTLVAERVWTETLKALDCEHPDVYFAVLRDCHALSVVFPEIDALFGVPQSAHHHPEIDTGRHLLLSLRMAARMNSPAIVRFAVLTHDLGKALTPAEILPQHIGHERKGLKLVRQFCQRLKTPADFQKLALGVAEYHTHCHRALELKPSTVLKTLRALDAFRRPAFLEQFLLACEADARGRLGLEQQPYPQADYLRQCFRAASGVTAGELNAERTEPLQGKALGAAIDRARQAAIARVKQEFA